MKKNSLLALLLLVSFGVAVPAVVFAQEFDDEEEYFEDEEDYDDGDYADSAAVATIGTADGRYDDEAYGAVGELKESTVGISNPDGRFTLAASPAALFMKIAEMERDNAIMKLKIEREKLNLDLERQRAEMQKVGLSLEEERAARARRAAEDEALIGEETMRRQLEAERQLAEIDRQNQENELNRRILDRISSADLSDPAQVAAIAQLLAFAPGAATTLPAAVREQITAEKVSAKNARDRNEGAAAAAAQESKLSSKFTIRSIVGARGQFTANLENNETKAVARLRHGSNFEGWIVSNVTRDSVVFSRDGETQTIQMK